METNNFLKRLIKYMKENTIGNDGYNYAISYGLFGTLIVLLKQIFSLLTYSGNKIANSYLYIPIFTIILLLIIGIVIIQINKIESTNKIAKAFIAVFPFLFTIAGVLTISLYREYTDRLLSYVIMMIMLTGIQIYPFFRRIAVFSFSLASFLVASYFHYGLTESFSKDLNVGLMMSFIIFIAASILSLIHTSNYVTIKDLDDKNKKFSVAIEKLKETHQELKSSKNITDSMFDLTLEVLKNEKIEDIMQLVLEKAVSLIPHSQAGSILIVNGNNMEFVAAKGYSLENLKSINVKIEETFQASLDDKFQPTIIRNLETYDNVYMGREKTKKLLNSSKNVAKSCLTCSFEYQGKFFGTINIDNFDEEFIFSERDLYLIKQLAQELSIIISIHKLYEQALRPAKFDGLTKANTRNYSMKLLKEMVETNLNGKISICMLDINKLKKINDLHGHGAGDAFLTYFGNTISNSNIKENIFGRIGGDEFVLIFNNTNKKEAEKEIEKIRQFCKKNPFEYSGVKLLVEFSAGVATYGEDGNNIQELIKLSDERMYHDKKDQNII